MEFERTDSDDKDFITLVRLLDAHLAHIDGKDHAFYAQYNKIDKLKNVIVAIEQGQAVACGAIKEFDSSSMEVKRMYTREEFRGKKIASQLLKELEMWAAELGYKKCVLETGKRMPDAVHLYESNGYARIPNYGQYIGVENSVCFEKTL